MIDVRLAFTAVMAMAMVGCGPAFTDGDYAIRAAPGFYFSDSGGDEKMILVDVPGGQKMILIDSRVNAYHVDKGRLYVSRSPRVLKKDSAGHLTGHVQQRCEFWSVDIASRTLKREIEGVKGLRCTYVPGTSAPGAWIAK
ncbi:hypothetical protein HZ993_21865 [Rhodoferax sp. AJA081-3]|uniref:hypothetical protein n=1 Tax=Rhodoferax sp. AJA081-3 TaxID=2752316 RepID=UPI001ADF5DC4|nr:hypothetical protein [Rhodoferax sp. AJA081-3]QTN27872.1 hypothetical protein HZ993_21865 [Rhodoferax sp. AJA081-3]